MYKLLLFFHILCGIAALISGLISFTAAKGRKAHILSGKLYTISMIGVALSAFALSLMKFNAFLFIVGLFSLYMTLTGYRALHTKGTNATDAWLMVFTGLSLCLFLGIMYYQTGFQLSGMLPVLLVFTGILAGMLLKDLRRYRKGSSADYRSKLRLHISRMGGAYIATTTAFVVTNVSLEPVYLKWLAPSLVGSLVIAWFQYRYTYQKKEKARQAA